MNKRQIILLFGTIAYVVILGSIIPIVIINLNLFGAIYDYFAELANVGVFFFLWIISTFFFFPFSYSTLVKGKLSLNVDVSKKRQKNPRYYALILLIIGSPIMVWLILGYLGYYSVTLVSGGLGDFVLNGFLVCIILLLYFCIFPAIILGLKKNIY
ncbi:MAG: hypothetical protein ACXAAH_02545 [Promethearchaeota archaeon]|jgi:hypothetical protein